jgi:ribosomal protein S18 acetylase RimI-like enzyme
MVAGRVDAATVDAEALRVYGHVALPFSVHTREHCDQALAVGLAARGYRDVTATPGMVLWRADAKPVAVPKALVVAPVEDDADRRAFADLMAAAYAVYGTPEESTRAFFATLETLRAPATQGFLGRVDGRAVAGAVLYLSHGIGGIGWVGTHPDAGGRGYGSALTWRVVVEGLERGVPLLNLQASPMGAPLYRRMGFTQVTRYRMFLRAA